MAGRVGQRDPGGAVGEPGGPQFLRPARDRLQMAGMVAARLRAVEQAYRTAIDHDTAYRPREPARTDSSPEHQPSRQSDPEAEP
jgi:hypothetical protein